MAEPEISRRCPSCGASYRAGALFCPQCGNALAPRASAETSIPAAPEVSNDHAVSLPEEPQEQSNIEASQSKAPAEIGQETLPSHVFEQLATIHAPADEKEISPAIIDQSQPVAPPAQQTPGTFQGDQSATRDILEDKPRPRVEKLRQASSVVLGEATYDPSLRFILVAVVLFLAFVVLLILSKVMG
jgi:uncharacterized Zn finger protein (UPF0148 family)